MNTLAYSAAAALLAAAAAFAQPAESLAPYFGFEEPRFVKVDEDCGPAVIADFNGDGRPDLAVVNNRKSRIEVYYLRAAKRTVEEQQRAAKVNELPPSPWYDREYVSVAHRVTALVAYDVDGDKRPDLVYAGAQPAELVVLHQDKSGKFDVAAKRRVKDLGARQDSLAIADVMGDEAPELITLAGDRVNIFPMDKSGRLGEPTVLGSGDKIRQVFVDDFNGDGKQDVMAVVPDDSSPLRLWLQSQDPGSTSAKSGLLAAELRFEMPQLREALPVRFAKRAAASIGALERTSQRVVFYDLSTQAVSNGPADAGSIGEREVQAEVTAFADTGSRNRSVAIADLSGNGLPDLITTDQKGNAVVVYRQERGVGLAQGTSFSAFKSPKVIDVGRWGSGTGTRLFVLSDEEKAVGVSAYDAASGRVSFPEPLALSTAGSSPVTMSYLEPGGHPTLALIVKDKRDYVLEVHQPQSETGQSQKGEKPGGKDQKPGDEQPKAEKGGDAKKPGNTVGLKDLKRDPAAILPFDADRDGVQDLLLLTPGEAMVMVRCEQNGGAYAPAQVFTKDTMPQFGLVQAAGPDNTMLLDADGDGKDELVIADSNYIRFCAYDAKKGWRVVDQVNVQDASTQLVGVALLNLGTSEKPDPRIIASDKANSRLLVFARNDAKRWTLRERVRVLGFQVGAIKAGAFAGDGTPSVLCLSDDAFALVRLGGQRPALTQFAAWHSDSENRLQHGLATGDLNGDGYTDVVVLDAKEQMCQILTFTASRKVQTATEFKVFESRLFQRGDTRELEPSDALAADLSGDHKDDLALVVHDRVIVYPQMAAPQDRESRADQKQGGREPTGGGGG